ncbi:MAG: lipid-binding SYLF domain-containing protein [candidate division NC10 bacterium]
MQRRMSLPGFRMRLTTCATVLAVALLAVAPGPAPAADSDQQALVEKAKATFETFLKAPEMGWFRDHLADSYGLVIFPLVLRAGFIFGLEGGSGVLVARKEIPGTWSDPAFYTLASGSFGLQIGAQGAEIILMVRSKKGVSSLLSSSLKLGADIDIALGPVGMGAKVKTASILAFARAKGIFGGVTVNGAVLSTRDEWNNAYYGRRVLPLDIIVLRSVSNKGAKGLLDAVTIATEQP